LASKIAFLPRSATALYQLVEFFRRMEYLTVDLTLSDPATF